MDIRIKGYYCSLSHNIHLICDILNKELGAFINAYDSNILDVIIEFVYPKKWRKFVENLLNVIEEFDDEDSNKELYYVLLVQPNYVDLFIYEFFNFINKNVIYNFLEFNPELIDTETILKYMDEFDDTSIKLIYNTQHYLIDDILYYEFNNSYSIKTKMIELSEMITKNGIYKDEQLKYNIICMICNHYNCILENYY